MTKNLTALKSLAIEYGIDEKLVNSISVNYSDKCNPQNGIMGRYHHFSKKITLMEVFNEQIFSTYIHELTHAMQHRELGTFKYILALAFLRFKLERDADQATQYAELFISQNMKGAKCTQ